MRAALVWRYGRPAVATVGDAPMPAVGPGDILVRVRASSLSRTDCGERAPYPLLLGRLIYGLSRPRRCIFGVDFAGEVEATGADVRGFNTGDRVFGICPRGRSGAHAEYTSIAQHGPIALLPAHVGFRDAVICEGAFYADSCLQRFGLQPGSKILIYGASGAIGSSAVQLAKHAGAEVTAVVGAQHVELARSLGADRVIDYMAEDFSKLPRVYDFALDAVGKTSFFKCRKVLKPRGMFIAADMGPWGQNIFLLLWASIMANRRVSIPAPIAAPALVQTMRELLEAGRFRPVIDRTYPLDDIVEAYRYVESGQKTGVVVIEI